MKTTLTDYEKLRAEVAMTMFPVALKRTMTEAESKAAFEDPAGFEAFSARLAAKEAVAAADSLLAELFKEKS